MFKGLGISGLGFSPSEIEKGCEVYKLDGVKEFKGGASGDFYPQMNFAVQWIKQCPSVPCLLPTALFCFKMVLHVRDDSARIQARPTEMKLWVNALTW